uniref:Large ribosomal subunit protein bL34c n=1 Tax=Melanthalia intermedia TaxID=172989 RepID=A0A345UAI4_9FLOR|nr:ribosomal protein L34 [Melanthalia intermedia]AXI97470.1 ribosomal protein L34 [Melanthalia intermedia]
MSKGTLVGTRRKKIGKSGFRARISSAGGRRILRLRRRKKRKRVSV